MAEQAAYSLIITMKVYAEVNWPIQASPESFFVIFNAKIVIIQMWRNLWKCNAKRELKRQLELRMLRWTTIWLI